MTAQQLPEGWQLVKFGEIAKHISKRVEPSETELDIYVGLEHLDPDSLKIKRHGVPSDVAGQKLLVKKGQIIFGKRRAYQRKVAVTEWDCICSAHAMVLEAKPDKIVSDFLPIFMQSDLFMSRAVAISEGSLSPTIKWKSLEEQLFLLPPKSKQKSLISVFNKLALVEDLQLSAEHASACLQNAFLMDIKSASINCSQLRSGRLIDFFLLQRGHDLTKKEAAEGDVPVISSSGFAYYHDSYILEGNAVITGRKGKLGDVYYFDSPCWPHDTTLYVKDFKGNYPKYVFWYLKSINLERLDAASAVPTLNRNNVHALKGTFPGYETQIKESNKLDEIESLRKTLSKKLAVFRSLASAIINTELSPKSLDK
ncbi:restriction endonuclease subunit S [Pseudomonas haemolytica]|uniref:Restriction endonuclease subunit S n=1 Tax=Pseudomonas haemolytica TaxID=2600065 RepID=A0A5P1DI82_9PSED|nr:restriction endonuclease subunit S [Pseudomonas haemolytica]MBK3449715.1 restriction endonuclease subunit S [Pseudomonas haemolytica]MRJ40201.1 restriction endonuclease subunit S [Pseudomonas haemolytica]